MARRRKKGATLTIEDLREELRQDFQRLEGKVDRALDEQGHLKVTVATTKVSAAAAHARVRRIETGLGVLIIGVITAAAAFVWEKAKGK